MHRKRQVQSPQLQNLLIKIDHRPKLLQQLDRQKEWHLALDDRCFHHAGDPADAQWQLANTDPAGLTANALSAHYTVAPSRLEASAPQGFL